MELILTDGQLNDIQRLYKADIDIDLGDDKTFEIKIRRGIWDEDIKIGSYVYIPTTEYGGRIGQIKTDTSLDTISILGYTWRGLLSKKIIVPPTGEDYMTVSGELNSIIRGLMDNDVIRGSFADTGVTIEYQFNRFCTLYDGIMAMLNSVGYKMSVVYVQDTGAGGHVEVSATPIIDYSQEIELSQDSKLQFKFTDIRDGVNHLIALGQGELQAREVIHLYANDAGEISTEQTFFGIDEIAEIYENTSTENLESDARTRFREVMNTQSFEMDIATLDINVEIGDIIGGRDYLTGLYMAQPVENKIWRIENGKETIDYKIKGDD